MGPVDSLSSTVNRQSLLFEVGTEEIPARFLPGIVAQVRALTREMLGEFAIEFTDIDCYATPRRIGLTVQGLPERQSARRRTVFGPPRHVAFDDKGEPTKAAIGFANSQGVDVGSLRVERKGKGEYVVAVIEEEGVPVRELLPGMLRRTLLSIHTPKTMRWGDGELRFVRPVHWIVAVLDGEVIDVEIDGLRSGRRTRGHRFLSPGDIEIGSAEEYVDALERGFVIVDQTKRRGMIKDSLERLSRSAGGVVVEDEELLETVTFLVEYPTAFLCSFPEEYLDLPKELLITVMRDHQKYFAVQRSDGALLNRFLVIGDTRPENEDNVRRGAEKVIRARFEDARFYYEDDLKRPLADRVEELRRVVFHEALGTLYDKVQRLLRVATELWERLDPEARGRTSLERVQRAALLSKADLITGVVREFPELQGLMGKHYALRQGEDEEVAEALYEQYLPAHAGGALPGTVTGAVLSISDRLDNIAGFFSIGLKPTGSEDPFALRRQALGVVAVLRERGYALGIEDLVDIAVRQLEVEDPAGLKEEIVGFFLQRLEPLFASEGYSHDTVQAVMERAGRLPLAMVKEIMDAVEGFKREPGYNETLLAFKRVFNILRGLDSIPEGDVNQGLLSHDEERSLYLKAVEVDEDVKEGVERGAYLEALRAISGLGPLINDFFDRVLVMDKDEALRTNRLRLLATVSRVASRLLDLSKLRES